MRGGRTARILAGLCAAVILGAAGVFFQLLYNAGSLTASFGAVRQEQGAIHVPTDALFSLTSEDERRLGRLRPNDITDLLNEAGAVRSEYRAVIPAVSYNIAPLRAEGRQLPPTAAGEPAFRLVFYQDPARADDFLTGARQLLHGALPGPESIDACAISEDLAEKNGLQVGSVISFLHYAGWNVPFYFHVTGIYRDNTEPDLPSRYITDFNYRGNEIVSTASVLAAEYTGALTDRPIDAAIPIAYEAVGDFPGGAPVIRISQLMEARGFPVAALAEVGAARGGGLLQPVERLAGRSFLLGALLALAGLGMAWLYGALLWPRQRDALLRRHCAGEPFSARIHARPVGVGILWMAAGALAFALAGTALAGRPLTLLLSGGAVVTTGAPLTERLMPYAAPLTDWPGYGGLAPFWPWAVILCVLCAWGLCLAASAHRARRFCREQLFDYMLDGG